MFGFYKDLWLKMNGIEPKGVLNTNTAPQGEKPLFSKKIKAVIWILGIMYFAVACVGISASIKGETYIKIVKYLVLVALDIVSIVFMMFKDRKKQFIAIGTIFLFVVFNFGATAI